MFARNLLQAGEFFATVPVGIPITLQYSEKGSLQKIFHNHNRDEWEDDTNKFLQPMIKNKQVPVKIPVKGGTTWVRAVLYADEIFASPGELPDCVQADAYQQYCSDPTLFTAYAGDVESLATTFRGAVPIRQWLGVAGFNILPGWVVPADLDERKFDAMVGNNYPFQYPLIASYVLFHKDGTISYPKTGLNQFVAKRVQRSLDESGNILANISDVDTDDTFTVPYQYVVTLNINANTLIVKNSDGDFLFTSTTDAVKREVRSNKIQCSCCGRQLVVPAASGMKTYFKCSDTQCNSVLYPRVKQLLSGLGLPVLPYDQYKKLSDSIGTIFSLPDIFDSEVYEDSDIHVTLTQAVRAIVPKSSLPGDRQVSQLVDACSNSVDTLCYYVQHLDKMKLDLGLDPHAFNRFYLWISQNENVSDFVELLHIKQIEFVSTKGRFKGAPIFRDKTIMLTGTFSRGSISEVSGILESYSASIVTKFNDTIDCVLVGDINENINGNALLKAKKLNIPVMQESAFFIQYDIDADMAENL